MMKHLSDAALLALAETGGTHPHVEQCATCRGRVESARQALVAARDVAVPEPSPLFWEHFSARVRESVAADGGRRGSWAAWLGTRGWRPAAAIAAIASCVVVATVSLGVFHPRPAERAARVAPAGTDTLLAADMLPPESERAWTVVTQMADVFDVDAAVEAGFAPAPGAADQAVLALSPSERSEFVRLLQTAMVVPSR